MTSLLIGLGVGFVVGLISYKLVPVLINKLKGEADKL